MYFYYITILLLFIPVLTQIFYPKIITDLFFKRFFIAFVLGICIVELGLRFQTGTDWDQYASHFLTQKLSLEIGSYKNRYELGYVYFVSLIKLFTSNYSVFLLIHASIFFLLLKKGYSFFTPYFFVALVLFYVTSLGVWGANRQFLAAAIGIIGLIYLYEKKYYAYAFCVFLAFMFHTSSIVMLLFIFTTKRINSLVLISALIASLKIGFTDLPYIIFKFFGSFSDYSGFKVNQYIQLADHDLKSITALGFLKRTIIFSFFLFARDRIVKDHPKFELLFNIYFISFCFYLIFVNTLTVMVSRGSFYFNIFEPILLSYFFCLLKNKKTAVLSAVVLFCYCIIAINHSIVSYPDLFDPYKGLFFNTHFHRTMH